MKQVILSNLEKVLSWARSSSLWYIKAGAGCCADEVMMALGCRYDLERFGCLPVPEPEEADLLILNGAITQKLAPHVRSLYDKMPDPKYVLAIGSCAVSCGAFSEEYGEAGVMPSDQVVPVDVYVAGCPPRPEAIMNGLIELQKKIGKKRHEKKISS